ncbi:unnamed protein product [Lupinus luteus]|uniref:Uncharacterized protein n=1 Tax=Lupinus luteus TaxID=3873 RepID=A0AAV1WA13_LUPLU
MGHVPGIKSIENSTSLSGGNPGISSGNTSGNSLTTGISRSSDPLPVSIDDKVTNN